ncbi:50S ribosomal protein L24 [Candidatus Gottesmanbacteria bacterium]|nr:50S ribosomal protein L24 [Candidatus Gottesmanbacteria bacterium]
MKLVKGDEVMVTGGKDKGRRGKVDRVLLKEDAVLLAGINLYKRHVKKRDEKHPGGIIDFPRPVPIARVALICPKCKQSTRVGFLTSDKEKQRVCRKCEQLI